MFIGFATTHCTLIFVFYLYSPNASVLRVSVSVIAICDCSGTIIFWIFSIAKQENNNNNIISLSNGSVAFVENPRLKRVVTITLLFSIRIYRYSDVHAQNSFIARMGFSRFFRFPMEPDAAKFHFARTRPNTLCSRLTCSRQSMW